MDTVSHRSFGVSEVAPDVECRPEFLVVVALHHVGDVEVCLHVQVVGRHDPLEEALLGKLEEGGI